MFNVWRDQNNPLIQPDTASSWYSLAAYNASPVVVGDELKLVFRAQAHEDYYHHQKLELSIVGVASSKDGGQTFDEPKPLVEPSEDWDEFGCEDPRVTKVGDLYYIFYTAIGAFPFEPDKIRCAVAISKDLKTIESKHLVTPFNAKAMALFPEKVNGKYALILTVHSDKSPSSIAFAYLDKLDQLWDKAFWDSWYANYLQFALDLRHNDSEQTEVGAVPILIEDGWLLVYSRIQEYFTEHKQFGIDIVILDRDNPQKVLKRLPFPIMVPEEAYEKYGRLPNIVFPSGALLDGDKLDIYYGSTDTTICRATLSLKALMPSLSETNDPMQYATRYEGNPILSPIEDHPWESLHVLNPAAVKLKGKTYILYRAAGPDYTSVVGLAVSEDGYTISERLPEPIYVPRASYEMKTAGPNTNSGCEDARVMHIGNRLYVTYTAYDGVHAPQVASSNISVDDFLAHKWDEWTMPQLVSPEGIDDKDAAIFERKFGNQYLVLHRIDGHICADYVDNLNFDAQKLKRCIQVLGPRPGMWDSRKVGIAGPPLETDEGWLLFYHGITVAGHYCLGVALLGKDDPSQVISRAAQPILTPILDWEKSGWISNVIFPCGQVVMGDTVFIYYGGADHAVGVATLSLSELLEQLRPA